MTSDNANTFTPSMPSRGSGFGLPGDSIQMNKIVRKDIAPKPPIDKHKITRDNELPQIPKLKKTEEPVVAAPKSVALAKEPKRRSSCDVSHQDFLKAEQSNMTREKIEANLKNFNAITPNTAADSLQQRRFQACVTPGINKRRLNRDKNTVIKSDNQQITPINAMTPINSQQSKGQVDLVEEDFSQKKTKTPATFNPLNKIGDKKDDPLMKFCKPKEEPVNKVQDSLNFLKQFGTSVAPGKKESESKPTSGMSRADQFAIPPFKPKDTKKSMGLSLEKCQAEDSANSKGPIQMPIPEIPAFNKIKSSKKSDSQLEKSAPIDSSQKSSSSKSVGSMKLIDSTEEEKVEEPNRKRTRVMYSALKAQNKLSIIHEEHKDIKEFIPQEQVPCSPYYRNVLVNIEGKVLYFSKFTPDCLKEQHDKSEYLQSMIRFNDEVKTLLSSHKRKASNRIDWIKLNSGKKYHIILVEINARETLTYLEKCFQALILNVERSKISRVLQNNSQFYDNELALLETKKKPLLEEIKESDEFATCSVKDVKGPTESFYSSYLSDSRSQSNTFSQGYSSDNDSYLSSDSIEYPAEIFNRNEGPNISVTKMTSKKLSPPVKPLSREKKKSKFGSNPDRFRHDSKKLISELQRKPSGKYMPRYDQEVTAFGFIKGANTVPLVSELLACSDRNNNMSEVYERLKFFTLECMYHTNGSTENNYLRILKELDLYLKSYEDENEDSEWDSDEECGAVSIAKELKDAIEEKASLTNEISAVELDLVAGNSTNSRDRLNSTKTNSCDGNSATASPSFHPTTPTDLIIAQKATEDSISLEQREDCLYKNVLSKGSNSPSPTKLPTKSGSLVISKTFSDPLEETKRTINTSTTPTLVEESGATSARIPRRFASNASFNQRSSSIHSIKSSKGAGEKRYMKKKTSGVKSNRKTKFSKSRKGSGSNESLESKSHRSTSHSKSLKRKKRPQNEKLTKGLSSFAKNKATKGNKKKKVRKVRPLVPKKSSKNATSMAEIIKIYSTDKPDAMTTHKMTPKKPKLEKDKTELPPKSPKLEKKSSKKMPKIDCDDDLEEEAKGVVSDEPLNKVKSCQPAVLKKKNSATDRRKTYQKSKLKSAVSNDVSGFVNIFNSFAEENFSRRRRKSRQSSGSIGKQLDTKGAPVLAGRTPKFLSNKDDHSLKLYSDKTIHIAKGRSRSLCWVGKMVDKDRIIRRTLSDFHELPLTRLNITMELYTGEKPKIKRAKPQETNESVSHSSLDRCSDSVSDETSQESKSKEESSDESEDLHALVRFYSLPILPSEKESLAINYDDELEFLHKTTFNKTTIDDFILLRAVSHGAYGKVCLARKKNTRDLFAIKIMDKQKMEEKGVTEQVINERNILNKVNNNYIVRGVYTFQTNKFLYIVMEYMKGGDFSSLLEGLGAFEEHTARIYLAQLVLAIEYLHSIDIIHRDLKPDNILIDSDGIIKLTDFGLSEINLKNIREQYKKSMDRGGNQLVVLDSSDSDSDLDSPLDLNMALLGQDSIQKRERALENKIKLTQDLDNLKNKKFSAKPEAKKILGTPDYIAPEVILGKEVTKSVDWWAVGVIAFEFMTGNLPFNDESPEKIFDNIIKKNIKWPPQINEALSPNAIDFIKKLMDYDVSKRLGTNGAQEIKAHPFFKDIEWDKIDEIEPPFTPQVDNEVDTTFFSNDKKNFDLKELQDIQNDMNNYSNSQFVQFDSTVIDTLAEINKKEAKKAMLKASSLSKYRSEVQIESTKKLDLHDNEYEFDSMFSKKK